MRSNIFLASLVLSFLFLPVEADDHRPVSELVKDLEGSPEDVRLKAAKELGECGVNAKAAVSAFNSLLKDPNPQIRIALAEAIIRITPDNQDAGPILVDGLSDWAPESNGFNFWQGEAFKAARRIFADHARLGGENRNVVLTRFGPASKDLIPAILRGISDSNGGGRDDALIL